MSQYMVQMDEDIQAAVEEACTPENVRRIIVTEAGREIELTIKNELHQFFAFGDGREAIRSAVNTRLKERADFIERGKQRRRRTEGRH